MSGIWFDSHCHLQEQYLSDAEISADGATPVSPHAASNVRPPDAASTARPPDAASTARPPDEVPTSRLGDEASNVRPPDEFPAVGALGRASQVVARAADAGVGAMVCVGTDLLTSGQAVELVTGLRVVGAPAGLWATIGLHPHDAVNGVDPVAGLLENTLAASRGVVVAVGECGLDYHYDHSPRDVQRAAFAAQIALAKRHHLALVVHTREAWADTWDILEAEGVPERTVFHCFTGGCDEARRCLDLGAHLSFSGIVTFKNAQDVRDAAALCPLDRLTVETDSPFLAPVPHRGEQNEPAHVAFVGEQLASIKGIAPEELAASSRRAAELLFRVGAGDGSSALER